MPVDLSHLTRKDMRDRRPWHGAAFIVESLVLLAFLMAALAVVVQLMGAAHERSSEARHLSNAIVLASNAAEEFAADPTGVGDEAVYASVDGKLVEAESVHGAGNGAVYRLTRVVEAHDQESGTLYTARIVVASDDGESYELATSRYVPDAEVAR